MPKKISTLQIGDGKVPNRYWVSISEDYYIFNEKVGGMDWISDHLHLKPKGATIEVFPSFRMARGWVNNNLYLGMKYDDIIANCITIEDRISGQVFEMVKSFFPEIASVEEEQFEDIRFTEEALKKRGLKFI